MNNLGAGWVESGHKNVFFEIRDQFWRERLQSKGSLESSELYTDKWLKIRLFYLKSLFLYII
jgi:hypothetical protein